MEMSASCLHILAATSSSRTIDHSNAASRDTKKRKRADKDAADQGILHKKPIRRGACEHGRVRYRCKECGGAGVCEHGRQRYSCKECGGAGICEHGRVRSKCKECGGTIIKKK